jgi:beta-lactamase regulating signal transducer with metallopeptidase domain
MTLLAAATLRVSLLMLAALALRFLARGQSATFRHRALGALLLLTLLPPMFRLPSAVTLVPTAQSAAEPTSTSLLAIAYVLGLAIATIRLILEWRRLRALRRACEPITDPRLHTILSRAATDAGLRRLPRLLASHDEHGPCAIGVISPAIILPVSALTSLSDDDMRIVLAHELLHIRERHLWLALAARVARTIWWFHPLVLLAAYDERRLREDACDELMVRRRIADDDRYCDVLLRVAASEPLALAAGFAAFHPLRTRIARIMAGPPRSSTFIRAATAALLLLVAGHHLGSQVVTPPHENTDLSPQDELRMEAIMDRMDDSPSPSHSPSPSPHS